MGMLYNQTSLLSTNYVEFPTSTNVLAIKVVYFLLQKSVL